MQKAVKVIKKYWPLYIMFIPGLAYLIINNYIPMTGIEVPSSSTTCGMASTAAPGLA